MACFTRSGHHHREGTGLNDLAFRWFFVEVCSLNLSDMMLTREIWQFDVIEVVSRDVCNHRRADYQERFRSNGSVQINGADRQCCPFGDIVIFFGQLLRSHGCRLAMHIWAERYDPPGD